LITSFLKANSYTRYCMLKGQFRLVAIWCRSIPVFGILMTVWHNLWQISHPREPYSTFKEDIPGTIPTMEKISAIRRGQKPTSDNSKFPSWWVRHKKKYLWFWFPTDPIFFCRPYSFFNTIDCATLFSPGGCGLLPKWRLLSH
jgi:hypothetical protein